MQRNIANPVPVTLLGQLGVDRDFQGFGHAASLIRFALVAAVRASTQVGSFGVITQPLDEELQDFYAKWGFQALPLVPGRTMIVRMSSIRAGLKEISQ